MEDVRIVEVNKEEVRRVKVVSFKMLGVVIKALDWYWFYSISMGSMDQVKECIEEVDGIKGAAFDHLKVREKR